MKKNLFEIIDFDLREDSIIVQIEKNNYVADSIEVPIYLFNKYLENHDRLYYESNDYSTGQLVSKPYYFTFENYWEAIELEDKQQDLYDYIRAKHIDFYKIMDIEINYIKSLINQRA